MSSTQDTPTQAINQLVAALRASVEGETTALGAVTRDGQILDEIAGAGDRIADAVDRLVAIYESQLQVADATVAFLAAKLAIATKGARR